MVVVFELGRHAVFAVKNGGPAPAADPVAASAPAASATTKDGARASAATAGESSADVGSLGWLRGEHRGFALNYNHEFSGLGIWGLGRSGCMY